MQRLLQEEIDRTSTQDTKGSEGSEGGGGGGGGKRPKRSQVTPWTAGRGVAPPRLLSERLVACYLIGSRVPLDKFTRADGYRILREGAGAEDHTGVVVGWDTMAHSSMNLGDSLPQPVRGTWNMYINGKWLW